MHELNDGIGLNATSISEITKIPRTTVIRKIAHLEKMVCLKKINLKGIVQMILLSKISNKLMPAMENNLEFLGVFFSQCLETYSARI